MSTSSKATPKFFAALLTISLNAYDTEASVFTTNLHPSNRHLVMETNTPSALSWFPLPRNFALPFSFFCSFFFKDYLYASQVFIALVIVVT